VNRRDALRLGATALAAALAPLPALAALPLEPELEALLARGAFLDRSVGEMTTWRRSLRCLVRHAERLVARHRQRAAAWYVLARLRWIDVDADMDEPRVLTLLEHALEIDPGHLPACALARHVADFHGCFEPAGPLLDEAVDLAATLVRLSDGHRGAVGLLRAQRELRRTCTGGGDVLPWSPQERELYRQLEASILARRWDGVSVAALPLW
jgi:hypothetical protein